MSIKNFRFPQFFSKKLLTFAEIGYIIQLPIAEVGNKIQGGVCMKNLLAEMARYGVSKYDIQTLLECSETTVRNKLSGESEFTVPEALKIRNSYFIGLRIEYLFATDEQATA